MIQLFYVQINHYFYQEFFTNLKRKKISFQLMKKLKLLIDNNTHEQEELKKFLDKNKKVIHSQIKENVNETKMYSDIKQRYVQTNLKKNRENLFKTDF